MRCLLANVPGAGLRRLAVGGVPVISAQGQIRHHLEGTLGSRHAALFAEPVETEGGVDWYSEAPGEARRFVELAAGERDAAAHRLAGLMEALDAHVQELLKSSQDYQRHLGQIMALALQIPDESHVWSVGDQPVLTFWGHTRDLGEPAQSPLYRLLPPPPAAPSAAAPGKAPQGPSSPQAASEPQAQAPTAPAAEAGDDLPSAGPPVRYWARVAPAAWAFSALLLLQAAAIGFLLLQSCSLSLPFLPGIDFCFAGRLKDEEVRTAALEAQRESLVSEIERKRTACRAPETLAPDLDAKSLAGCWRTDRAQFSIVSTDAQGNIKSQVPVRSEYCFDPSGESGTVSYRGEDGYLCEGPITISRSEDELRFEHDALRCASGGDLSRGRWICRTLESGETRCDGATLLANGEPNPKHVVNGAQFFRVEGGAR